MSLNKTETKNLHDAMGVLQTVANKIHNGEKLDKVDEARLRDAHAKVKLVWTMKGKYDV